MLGKLLKYELKATGRKFVPVYIALIVFALLKTFFGTKPMGGIGAPNFIGGITTIVLVGLFVALAAMTIIVIIQRFYESLLRDEGYLMFTLPVTPKQLILSKVITTFIWGFMSVLVGIVVFLILFADYGIMSEGMNLVKELLGRLDMSLVLEGVMLIGQFVFFIIGGVLLNLLIVYLALAISQMPFAHKYRVPVAFVAFFVLEAVLGYCTNLFWSVSSVLSLSYTLVGTVGDIILSIVVFELISYVLTRYLNLE